MFKRFAVADDVSTQTAIKSSVIRSIRNNICEQYPAIEPYIDDIIPKKDVLEAKGKDKLTFVVVDGQPLFFRQRDGPYYPTLHVLHRYPIMMPRIVVDAGAIRFVLGGADVMIPGILSSGGGVPVELPAAAPVSVYANGKEHALAVGVLTMSTAEMRAKKKGIGINVMHHLDDMLWHTPSFA